MGKIHDVASPKARYEVRAAAIDSETNGNDETERSADSKYERAKREHVLENTLERSISNDER